MLMFVILYFNCWYARYTVKC